MNQSVINFFPHLAPLIENGRIPLAIRPRYPSKRNPEAGDTLYLFAGRLVGREVCERVADITIFPPLGATYQVMVGSQMLEQADVATLAQDCGFADEECMVGHIEVNWGLPFNGNLIVWQPSPQPPSRH